MALPAAVQKEAESVLDEYCRERSSDQARVSYGIRGSNVTLYDEQPPWDGRGDWSKLGIAQFRYKDGEWTLYSADRNERWQMYFDADSSEDIRELLDEVDDDPTGIFWD